MSILEIKNGNIYYNTHDKQFVVITHGKSSIDSGISCILSMSGYIETLSMAEEYKKEIYENVYGKWLLVGNLTNIFRKCI